MEQNAYLTLRRPATDRFTEKKSEFIGYAAPLTTEEEAAEFLRSVRAAHGDARHCVYAYILRQDHLSRFSDDGEPQGTAGMPTLDVLRKTGLTDCGVAVVRYFGGILLGTGGLVRAYTHAARLAVTAAEIVERREFDELFVRIGYPAYQRLPAELQRYSILTDETSFSDTVLLRLAVPCENTAAFLEKLTDLSGGSAAVERLGKRFDFSKSSVSAAE